MIRTSARLRRRVVIAICWAIFASIAVVVPASTAGASQGVQTGVDWATYDSLFMADMSTRIAGPATTPGVSRFGADPTLSAAPVTVAFDHGSRPTRADLCDADNDGSANGVWAAEQSDGDDSLSRRYLENRAVLAGPWLPLTKTEPGYRTNVWVCTEFVGAVSEVWVDKREPFDQIVLADEAIHWYQTATERAQAQVSGTLYEPGWQIWPAHRSRQIVGLPSWLYITDEAWEFEPSSTAEEGEVTVQAVARPVKSVWQFEDGETITCDGRGNEWQTGLGLIDPPTCGREWDHTHAELDLEVALTYEVEWISSLSTATIDLDDLNVLADGASPSGLEGWRASANGARSFSGRGIVDGPFREPVQLRVGEVQAYGSSVGAREQLPPPESEPIIGKLHEPCGGFWGFVGCTLSNAIQVLDAVASFLIPGFEEIKKFAKGCGDAGTTFVTDLIDQIKSIPELIKNPFKAASDAWDAIKAMQTALAEDAVGFATEFLGAMVEADRWENQGPLNWAGFMICTRGIEWIMSLIGVGAAALAQKLLTFMKKFKGRNGSSNDGSNNDGSNNDGSNDDGSNDDGSNDDGSDGDGTCRASSFPAGTLVLLADGTHRPIERIRPGDSVMSHNLPAAAWQPKLVVDQWSHRDRGPPATATLADGATITATDDHLFWVDSTATWTELQHLQTGDELLTTSGPIAVDSLSVGPRHPWTVWELTVVDNHNFTVNAGDHDILVHNAACKAEYDGDFDNDFDAKHRPKKDEVDPDALGLSEVEFADRQKPRNASGELEGGWASAPDPKKLDANGNPVYEVWDNGDGGLVYRTEIDGKAVTVEYNSDGYPDFTPHAELEVKVEGGFDPRGRAGEADDYAKVNSELGDAASDWGRKPPEGYNWHHVTRPDGDYLQLIPDSIHLGSNGGFPHAGGISQLGP